MAKHDLHSFQGLIFTLQEYWAGQGCVVLQPYDMEVGAGTFHPATFLRALGSQPWRAAYVQPSRRPTDGRYGENPNRLQHYYQYQVVLKPSPLEIQELYLGSLRTLGIDSSVHDIRFVEDNWESPTLGAWGLGWEVWLNGMEVTQFTYFQQVGGIDCRPVTVAVRPSPVPGPAPLAGQTRVETSPLASSGASDADDGDEPTALMTPIEDLSFSARTTNALINNEIQTLKDLVSLDEAELRDLKGFGNKALDEVKEKVDELEL